MQYVRPLLVVYVVFAAVALPLGAFEAYTQLRDCRLTTGQTCAWKAVPKEGETPDQST